MQKSRRTPQGFTFLEIMLVVMIIGLLSALVGPRIMQSAAGAGERITRVQIGNLSQSLNEYALSVGAFPTTQQGLEALIECPSDVEADLWSGPYISAHEVPADAWRRAYRYEFPTTRERVDFALWSLGKDGVDGTADDIVNWPK